MVAHVRAVALFPILFKYFGPSFDIRSAGFCFPPLVDSCSDFDIRCGSLLVVRYA